ncbi:MAG TPA: hypothetical protein VJU54_03610, partial [Nitrospiraceae bacterium]|nr:hypothetical protein [Nitrospiraceae bacterium]
KVRQHRSRIAQRLNMRKSLSEVGSTKGILPFTRIHRGVNGPYEVRYVPPCLLVNCGLTRAQLGAPGMGG